MASQPGLQMIAILILPNISQNKGNQAMKLINITREIFFFFRNYAENEVRRLLQDLFLFFK